MIQRLAIVTPIFNDWASFGQLVADLKLQPGLKALTRIDILAVNDGSSQLRDSAALQQLSDDQFRVSVLDLKRNVGHQNAIATGLGWTAAHRPDIDAVVVMDGDGEDTPEALPRLIEASRKAPGAIIFAQRGKRRESLMFRTGYAVYKQIFRLLTGKAISFGNFSLVPAERLKQLCSTREIWHSYAAGVMRSRVPLQNIRIDRGSRYFGQSKMNLTSLVLHGLSAVAVFADIAAVRIIMASLTLVGISAVGIAAVISMKFLGLASPGWASTIALLLSVLSLQCLTISAVLLFVLFVFRSMSTESPASASLQLVGETEHYSSPS